MAGTRSIAPHLSLERNTSVSFQQFISGVHRYIEQVQESL